MSGHRFQNGIRLALAGTGGHEQVGGFQPLRDVDAFAVEGHARPGHRGKPLPLRAISYNHKVKVGAKRPGGVERLDKLADPLLGYKPAYSENHRAARLAMAPFSGFNRRRVDPVRDAMTDRMARPNGQAGLAVGDDCHRRRANDLSDPLFETEAVAARRAALGQNPGNAEDSSHTTGDDHHRCQPCLYNIWPHAADDAQHIEKGARIEAAPFRHGMAPDAYCGEMGQLIRSETRAYMKINVHPDEIGRDHRELLFSSAAAHRRDAMKYSEFRGSHSASNLPHPALRSNPIPAPMRAKP